jgi:hypothetical protein
MKRVDLDKLDSETAFKIKMEAYLYIDAGKMIKFGKGDKNKLTEYMEKRVGVIEAILKISRPFVILDGSDVLLEVEK